MRISKKICICSLVLLPMCTINCGLIDTAQYFAGQTRVTHILDYWGVTFLDSTTIVYVTREYDSYYSLDSIWISGYTFHLDKRDIYSNRTDTLLVFPFDSIGFDYSYRISCVPPAILSSVAKWHQQPPSDSFYNLCYNLNTGEHTEFRSASLSTLAGTSLVAFGADGTVVDAATGEKKYTISKTPIWLKYFRSTDNNALFLPQYHLTQAVGNFDPSSDTLRQWDLPSVYNRYAIMPVDRSRYLFIYDYDGDVYRQTMFLPADGIDSTLSQLRSVSINTSFYGRNIISDINVSAQLIASVYFNRFEIRTFSGDLVLQCKVPQNKSKPL